LLVEDEVTVLSVVEEVFFPCVYTVRNYWFVSVHKLKSKSWYCT